MKNKGKKFIVALLLVLLSGMVNAQVFRWVMKPTSYSSMERLNDKMFKVKREGKIGFVGNDGRVLVEPKYEGMTGFYGGTALLLTKSGERIQVCGFLSSGGGVTILDKPYYAIPSYPFFNEGMLPVRGENGKEGFVDENGSESIPCKYRSVAPFCDGLALVTIRDEFDIHYIKKDGSELPFYLSNGGEVNGGTSFYKGHAYVYDEDEVFFDLDVNGNCVKTKTPKSEYDYLHRKTDGQTPLKIPYDKPSSLVNNSSLTLQTGDNGLYGYSQAGKNIIPCQFEKADPFINDVALVTLNGKFGLLTYDETGGSFSVNAAKKNFVFSPGSSCQCAFSLSVPNAMKNMNLSVNLKEKESNVLIPLNNESNGKYSFSYKPSNQGKRSSAQFDISVRGDGMLLWTGQEVYSFVESVPLRVTLSVGNTKADANDHCYVSATVTNPSMIDVTTVVHLSGTGTFDNKSVTVTVPAKGSRVVSSFFVVKKAMTDQRVNVSTSEGGSDSVGGLELIPFYTGG